jgi:hypothetical protein
MWFELTRPSSNVFLEQLLPELVHSRLDDFLIEALFLKLELQLDALIFHPPFPLVLEDPLVWLALSSQMVIVSSVRLRPVILRRSCLGQIPLHISRRPCIRSSIFF